MMGNVRKMSNIFDKKLNLDLALEGSQHFHTVLITVFYLIFKLTTKLGVYRSIVNTESLLSIDLVITLDQIHLFKGRIIFTTSRESRVKINLSIIIDHFIRNIRRYVVIISPISEGVFKIV